MPSLLHESLTKLYKDKKVLILGFAREGKSTARILHEAFPERRFSVMDKQAVDLSDFPYLTRQEPYLANLGDFDAVFKTAGVSISEPAINEYAKNGGTITSQLNEFLRVYAPQTTGVTGTKGKSTTSALLKEMLRTAGDDGLYGGNIGIPAFDLVDKIKPSSMIILEMSSYQLETVKFSPHIALLLNIFPEHLDYHGTLDGYLEAKANITRFQTPSDLLFYDGSFPTLTAIAAKTVAWATNFTSASELNAISAFTEGLSDLPEVVRSKNAPAAIAIARRLGVSDEAIAQALHDFKPLPHRLEKVGTFKDITFYDDTLATVPEATIAAIDSLQRIDAIIVGGFDRGIDYSSIADKIVRNKIPYVILFPTTGEKIAALIKAQTAERQGPVMEPVNDMQSAVHKCFELLPHGGTVLLSPASPSFGLFKDYEDKSSQYVSWIKTIAADVDKK